MKKNIIIATTLLIVILVGLNLYSKNTKPALDGYKYFGNEAIGDLNADGRLDKAFLVTENPGGSGTFFYVVVAINKSNGEVLTKPFFIGDRIAPQTTEINSASSTLLVNYADRKIDEPMTTQPSIGKTLRLKLNSSNELE